MRTVLRLVAVVLLATWGAHAVHAQITANPVPAPIRKRGLATSSRSGAPPIHVVANLTHPMGTADGALLVTSRQDGMIRMLVPEE